MTNIAILGAGCAGLSLAYHLLERGHRGGIELIDPREGYGRDRTFCFWNVVEHPFADLVTHRWPRWRVRDRGDWIERRASGLFYEHLPSDRFYERALERLRRAGIEPALRTKATHVADLGDRVRVETDRGELRADLVFDSRPPSPRAVVDAGREVTLLQHFAGWEIETERAAFDPEVATLMDFAVPQDRGTHFVYVLPYGRHRALVEATWFSPSVLNDAQYEAALARYTEPYAPYRVIAKERGVIPMSSEIPEGRASARVIRIGTAGGLVKPSTGYAFQAIQRFSAAMAKRAIAAAVPEPPRPRSWRATAMDRMFLSYLARHPDRGPATLSQLFRDVEPRVLVRFLSDLATASDCLEVMRRMPFAPMSLEVARSHRLWLRR